jgi:membrane-bound hydrogenase subunit mbhJ
MAKGLTKSFKKALWVYHCNSGSCNGCDIEIIAALCPRYDVERFGIKLVGSPRHADALLITGPVTRQMVDRLLYVLVIAAIQVMFSTSHITW